MSVYLRDIPISQAQSMLKRALIEADLWRILGSETLPLDEFALGRVLAEPVWAKISSPHYHASAMDGFAVRALATAGAQPTKPVILRVGPDARYIDTGDPLPEDFNAVIPIENVEPLDAEENIASRLRSPVAIRIRVGVTPWSHVRPMGEDMVVSQLVLPTGHTLRPVDLGAIAAAGHDGVVVARKPRVAILPTGTELVTIGTELTPGLILEYNSLVLAGQVRSWGGDAIRYPITPDDFDAISLRVMDAARGNDLILLNAGSSAGAEDFSAKVVSSLGDILVHGVAVRPGHPVILGMLRQNCAEGVLKVPIIGVPGYPVSSALTAEIFVEPMISKWIGRSPLEHNTEAVTMTRKVVSPAGDDDYIRVTIGRVGDRVLAAPLPRGAGVISSLVRADGVVILPRGVQGVDAGQIVTAQLYRSKADLEKTIFCIGSHDMLLDLIAQYLAGHNRRMTSANVGSQGGLIALQRGEAHLAGSHLLDPKTGEYNLPYLSKYLPDKRVRVIVLVEREQGLLLHKGNPKGIQCLGDLTRSDIRFINRQRGAGTRVLLDYELEKIGTSGAEIHGYNQEEYTHLGVAAAVASGRADCGLGIAAAARALALEFLPLFQERYDLVIPLEFAESSLLDPLFTVIDSKEFRAAVEAMPGYNIQRMGQILVEA
ncbi:MAG: molybdopterin biosynthesis protein [Chloroflexota bacterium]